VLAGLEVKLDRPQASAVQVAAIAAATGVTTYVEVPRPTSPDWPAVLKAVAAHGLRLTFRTGGTEAAAFPTEDEMADWIMSAVAQDLPFKCTAGLHNAVRHTGANTGFEHHGYLNILLADAVRATPHLAAARARFTSYGSCSVVEPYEDLVALDLLT
jgi:hypothetical protein